MFATNKKYKCLSVGYEISPVLLIIQKLAKLLYHPFNKNIKIKEESFLNADLSEYNVIYCCLPPTILENLEEKFRNELKNNTKVFSYKVKLPNRKAKEHRIDDSMLYEYTYPSS